MENVVIIFGMSFVGMILICLCWSVLEYIFKANMPKNKLEENMKEFDKSNKI